jgi:uncharacterized repeat protein (TIGR01451 family)
MKRILFFLLIITIKLNAQMYYMPDSMLKIKLTNLGYAACIVGDSINSTCSLVANATYLDVSNYNILSLQGIEAFSALNKLICSTNSNLVITSLPPALDTLIAEGCYQLSLPVLPSTLLYLNVQGGLIPTIPALPNNLRYINCSNNKITSLPALPDSLRELRCNSNLISIIPNLPNELQIFDCSMNFFLISLPSLPPNLSELYCESDTLLSLPALPNSLSRLYCKNNHLDSLPSLPPALAFLDCYNNSIAAIPALPNSLIMLSCSYNQITSLPALPSLLELLACEYNQLTSLPVLPNSLDKLDCSHNSLTSLPAIPANMRDLNFAGNSISTMPTLPANLYSCNASYNPIGTISPLPAMLNDFRCDSCGLTYIVYLPPTLSRLELNQNQLTSLPQLPQNMSMFLISDNPISCLPQLGTIGSFYFNNTSIACLPNYGNIANSYPAIATLPLCDIFNANGCDAYWNISGQTYFDSNLDCINNSLDRNISNMHLNLLQNGILQQQVLTGGSGHYSFDVSTFGNYDVQLDTQNIPFTVLCPLGNQYIDTISVSDSMSYANDFALHCKNGYDLGAWSIYTDELRPSHRSRVIISAGDLANFFNANCALGVSGTITVTITGNVHYFGPLAGYAAPAGVAQNVLTWPVANFGLINGTSFIGFEMETDTSAIMGSSVCIAVDVTPGSSDYDPSNNHLVNCFTVQSSFDPNDKMVYPDGTIDTTQQSLTYTIRFQNTGTASADNIYITDTLDADLDASTFELLATSHGVVVQILPGNIVKLSFPNINLPDSNTDEHYSHGFVQYKISLNSNLAIGTQISNTAYIYFDFNQPVVTNTTLNEIDLPNGVSYKGQKSINLKVYPLPFSDHLTIESNSWNETFRIFDLFGREICKRTINGAEKISTSEWSAGFYFIKTDKGQTISIVK